MRKQQLSLKKKKKQKTWLCSENLHLEKFEFIFTYKIGSKLKSTTSGPFCHFTPRHMGPRHRARAPEVARAGVWVRVVGAQGWGSSSWVPSLFDPGEGGRDRGRRFLKRHCLVASLWGDGRWGEFCGSPTPAVRQQP